MYITYPDEPLAAPNSLTRERALHMAHFPELYQAARQRGELPLPGGANGQGWNNFLNNPSRYIANLTVYGLGGGLARKGDWMTAYSGPDAKIPMRSIATAAVNPTEVRVLTRDNAEARKAKERARNAKNAWLAQTRKIGGGHSPNVGQLRKEYERAQRAADKYDDQGRRYRYVTFDNYMQNHLKYHDPLQVDEKYFKAAIDLHRAHVKRHDFAHNASRDGVAIATDMSPTMIRESMVMLFGDGPAALENDNVALDGETYTVSSPVVIKGNDALPYLAYGLNHATEGTLSTFAVIQDPKTGDVTLTQRSALSDFTPAFLHASLAAAISDYCHEPVPQNTRVVTDVDDPSPSLRR